MNSMIWITIVLFLPILSPTSNDKENQAADNQPMCLPFKAILVWHTDSENGDSFYQQKRLLIKLIDLPTGFPEGTDISLVTVGEQNATKLRFKKKISYKSWLQELDKIVPGKSKKHGIPYLELNNAVNNHFNKVENPKMAEEIFLIISNKSRIDEQLKAFELLRKKKTYVIIYGKQTSGNVLTNLATDNRHVIGLGDSSDSINDAEKCILSLSCQDSKLVCDTDKYWNENRCYTCTNLCSPEAWIPYKYCYDACPYYMHTLTDKDREVDHSTPPDKDQEVYDSVNRNSLTASIFSILSFIVLLLIVIYILVSKFCRKCISLKAKIRRFCRKEKKPENGSSSSIKYTTPVAAQEGNAHQIEGNEDEGDILVADGDEYNTNMKDQVEQNERNESINDDRDSPVETYNGILPDHNWFDAVAIRSEDKT